MDKRPTIKDIATKLNISSASVSMILNKKNITRFSPETVEAVFKHAEQIGYMPKHRKIKKDLITLICPSVINPYYSTILQSIEHSALENGYKTIINTTYWNPEMEKFAMDNTDYTTSAGVIFLMPPQQPQYAVELNKKIPVVVIGDENNDLKLDAVDVSNYSSAQLIGNYLIELGHKKVAYISTTLDEHHSARVLRYKGLKNTFSKINEDIALYCTTVTYDTEIKTPGIEYSVGYNLAVECIKKTPDVTALVAINDMVAFGVIDAIINLGYNIPKDYSVCGFDNILPSKFNGISLTTIDHSIFERGRNAFKLLMHKIHDEKEKSNSEVITKVEYQSKLVVRNSTGTPRKYEIEPTLIKN